MQNIDHHYHPILLRTKWQKWQIKMHFWVTPLGAKNVQVTDSKTRMTMTISLKAELNKLYIINKYFVNSKEVEYVLFKYPNIVPNCPSCHRAKNQIYRIIRIIKLHLNIPFLNARYRLSCNGYKFILSQTYLFKELIM